MLEALQTQQGSKYLAQVIDDCLQQIQKFRLNFLEKKDTEEMLNVRTLVKMLCSCVSQEGKSNLYKDLFEPKFIQKTQMFYEKQQ